MTDEDAGAMALFDCQTVAEVEANQRALYRVTLQFRRDAYVAAPSIVAAQKILTSPLVQALERANGATASVVKVQSLDPYTLSVIELNHPVYTPEGEEIGSVIQCSIASPEPRRRTWLNCPTCCEELFLLGGFQLEGDRCICNVCGTVAALVVGEHDEETRPSLRFVDVVEIGQPECDGSCNRAPEHPLCTWSCTRASEALNAWDWQRLSPEARRAIDGFLEAPGDLEREEIDRLAEQALAVFGRGAERAWPRNWFRERAQTVVAWRASTRRQSP